VLLASSIPLCDAGHTAGEGRIGTPIADVQKGADP
jgi:hypothetical protein